MNEEMRVIVARIAGLERSVGRLQQAVGGVAQAIGQAAQLSATCAKCENNPEGMKSCTEQDCPCGLPQRVKDEGNDLSTEESPAN